MSLMSSLYKMGSGLSTAQSGLYTTSHNISNTETKGYSRQRIVQTDSFYSNIGNNASGDLKVGMGVEVSVLEQIRNNFLDISYRQESSRAQYYATRETTVSELENILGEINGESVSAEMSNLWDSLNNLSKHPEGIETRTAFLQTAVTFITKANNINDKIEQYQYNLDTQVRNAVTKINSLSEQVADYNGMIAKYESAGDHANDYRDQRNLLLDELSTYGEITVKEDISGQVNVLFEGNTLVQKGYHSTMGLQYVNGVDGQSFVQPIWSSETEDILGSMDPSVPVYSKTKLQNISQVSQTDTGILKGLLTSRGDTSAQFDTLDTEIKGFIIPKVQKELDVLVNSVVNMLNDMVTYDSTAPVPPLPADTKVYDAYGKLAGLDKTIFTKIDAAGDYTLGNLQVNQTLLDNSNLLGLSLSGDVGDNTLVEDILAEWKNSNGEFSPLSAEVGYKQNFETYYAEFVARLGSVGQEANNMVVSQTTLLNDIDNKRLSVSGVSLDEEMSNMIIYQHAYNAAAKVYNVIDTMLESVLNM